MSPKTSHSHWGAFEAEVVEGEIRAVRPFSHDTHPSALVRSIPSAVHAESRIRQPMVRAGYLQHGPADTERRRGAEPFVPISWDEALSLVADRLSDVKARHGNQAIFGGSYGWSSAGRINHARTLVHRFLYRFGGCVGQVTNYSFGTAAVLLPRILGGIEAVSGPVSDWPGIVADTKLMVLFGGANAKNMRVTTGGAGSHESPGWLRAAKAAGCEFMSLSPLRSDCPPEIEAEWLPIRPGSDTALMLGLAHTLVAEDLVDRAFIDRYTVGYQQFEDYLLGRTDGMPKTAAWASRLTDIPEATILDLARRIAGTRTMLSATWSLQRADHGEQPYWALIALACMVGQIGLPGGGFGFGYGSINGMGVPRRPIASPAMEAGSNPLGFAIPVARMADMLLEPGRTIPFDGKTVTYPDIRLVYWCGGNPFHHHQDINRLVEAWRRPETIIVQDIWWTATAQQADIVLPATTSFERDDIGASPLDRFIVAMPQLIPPQHAARNDYDIFAELAGRLGFESAFTEGRDIRGWIEHAYEAYRTRAVMHDVALPPFADFWKEGFVEVPPPRHAFTMLGDFRADPVAHRLRTPSGRIEIASRTIESFGYDDCPGHPTWLPPREWLGSDLVETYPLHLISNQPATRLHSQLDKALLSQESKVAGHEPIMLNPIDAERRSIASGDLVRVYNDRGSCLAGAVVSDDIRAGVVQLATGAWYRPEAFASPGSPDLGGNPNVLTRDAGTSSLGQGPSALSALVEVAKCAPASR